jgi:hypothetical protein
MAESSQRNTQNTWIMSMSDLADMWLRKKYAVDPVEFDRMLTGIRLQQEQSAIMHMNAPVKLPVPAQIVIKEPEYIRTDAIQRVSPHSQTITLENKSPKHEILRVKTRRQSIPMAVSGKLPANSYMRRILQEKEEKKRKDEFLDAFKMNPKIKMKSSTSIIKEKFTFEI